jgi:hypothetical protein
LQQKFSPISNNQFPKLSEPISNKFQISNLQLFRKKNLEFEISAIGTYLEFGFWDLEFFLWLVLLLLDHKAFWYRMRWLIPVID